MLQGVIGASCLFEFDQGAEEILRVNKDHGLAVSPDLRFAVAEDARATSHKIARGRMNIGDLVADVMDAPEWIATP
jgi:hypothetical protein